MLFLINSTFEGKGLEGRNSQCTFHSQHQYILPSFPKYTFKMLSKTNVYILGQPVLALCFKGLTMQNYSIVDKQEEDATGLKQDSLGRNHSTSRKVAQNCSPVLSLWFKHFICFIPGVHRHYERFLPKILQVDLNPLCH